MRSLFCCKKKKNKKDKIKINDYCKVNQKEIKIDDILKIKVQFDNNSIVKEKEIEEKKIKLKNKYKLK